MEIVVDIVDGNEADCCRVRLDAANEIEHRRFAAFRMTSTIVSGGYVRSTVCLFRETISKPGWNASEVSQLQGTRHASKGFEATISLVWSRQPVKKCLERPAGNILPVSGTYERLVM